MSSNVDLRIDRYPRITPRSHHYRLTLNGQAADVLDDNVGDFATFATDGPVDVCVDILGHEPVDTATVAVRPLSRGISAQVVDRRIQFTLPWPRNVAVDVPGRKPLYLMVSAPDPDPPDSNAPGVHYFAAGQVYEVGDLVLKSGDTVYIEGGAVVRGALRAENATDIRIAGRGVLDNSYFLNDKGQRCRPIVLTQCQRVCIDGITIVKPISWMVVLYLCEDVHISNIHNLGEVISSDGIDVVSSQRVRIADCFIVNSDDCIVVKALPSHHGPQPDYSGDVDDVLVERCVLGNYHAGNAMEIGFELRTAVVSNITFRDCDVLHVYGYGAVFSIHNTDRAVVHDVLYENIRVEHYYDRLIDLCVVMSKYAKDEQRGHIRNIVFRDIALTRSEHNPGYTKSLIGGYDADHLVENVTFENVRINGVPITSLAELDLFVRHVGPITIL